MALFSVFNLPIRSNALIVHYLAKWQPVWCASCRIGSAGFSPRRVAMGAEPRIPKEVGNDENRQVTRDLVLPKPVLACVGHPGRRMGQENQADLRRGSASFKDGASRWNLHLQVG